MNDKMPTIHPEVLEGILENATVRGQRAHLMACNPDELEHLVIKFLRLIAKHGEVRGELNYIPRRLLTRVISTEIGAEIVSCMCGLAVYTSLDFHRIALDRAEMMAEIRGLYDPEDQAICRVFICFSLATYLHDSNSHLEEAMYVWNRHCREFVETISCEESNDDWSRIIDLGIMGIDPLA